MKCEGTNTLLIKLMLGYYFTLAPAKYRFPFTLDFHNCSSGCEIISEKMYSS